MKLEPNVAYENISDKVDKMSLSDQGQGHSGTEIFLHLPQYKLSGPITQL